MDPYRQRNSPTCRLHIPGKNRLLILLEEAGEGEIVTRMERVTLKRRTPLASPHQPITHAYFPLSGVASLVLHLDDGPTLEIGTMGNEGMVGIPLLLGSDRSHNDTFVQIEGEFMRMNSLAFAEELGRSTHLARIGNRYVQAFFAVGGQSAACIRFHPIEQRLCRWILDTHDRVGSDVIPLTQEFLAMMLGVQRPSVSLAAGQLQEAGMIRYRHGVIEVLDRSALEATACGCYATVRSEFERLLC
jgi:CRP-like cAMP-binding protein